MEDFRRFILGVADTLAVILVLAVTLGAALTGAALGAATGAFAGASSSRPIIGFFVGGAFGFMTAALGSALLFCLMEIAANTRRTRELLEQGTSTAPTAFSSPTRLDSTQTNNNPIGDEFSHWITSNGQTITRTASAYLVRAKNLGYSIVQQDDNAIIVRSPDDQSRTLKTNADILSFGVTLDPPT